MRSVRPPDPDSYPHIPITKDPPPGTRRFSRIHLGRLVYYQWEESTQTMWRITQKGKIMWVARWLNLHDASLKELPPVGLRVREGL